MFSMQGKRDNNEDRAVIRTVRMVEDIDKTEVHVWAVMDGHGGQVKIKDLNISLLLFSSQVLCRLLRGSPGDRPRHRHTEAEAADEFTGQ